MLDVKQRQLEDVIRSNEILKEKEDKISDLYRDLTSANDDLYQKGLEIKHLSNYIEDVKNKHKLEIDKQMQYNTANEKTLARLTERERDFDKALKEMNASMEDSLNKYDDSQPIKPTRKLSYGVDMNISPLDHAKSMLKRVLALLANLYVFKEKYENLSSYQSNAGLNLVL